MTPSATQSDLARRWLHGLCERGGGVQSAVVLLDGEQGLQETARWPDTGAASPPLVAAARAAFQRRCAIALTPPVAASDGPGRILSQPVAGDQGTLGAFAVAVQAGSPAGDEALQEDLKKAAQALAGALQGSSPPPQAAGARLLHLQAPLLEPRPLAQAAGALVSALADTLDFEQVSLGLLAHGELKVVALSHSGEPSPQGELIRALAGAMQEAIDQNASVVYPQPPEAPPRIVLAHAALAARGREGVLSIPLIHAGESIGALCLERSVPVTAEACRAIEQLACLLAPLIDLKRRAEEPWHTRAREALRSGWEKPGRRLGRIGWLAGLGAALLLAFTPMAYRVGAPGRLEGAVQRVLAAPADGYLQSVQARPGDEVRAGQVLVGLAQQDLLLQSRKWEAELAQHENSAAAALARADRAQYALATARAGEAEAQLELARAELDRSRVTAPIDGIVIKGDLSQSLGAPVKRGDVLLTLAPRGAFRLMIEVDERDIGDIAPGQRGRLALSALPGEQLAFSVSRVIPIAASRDGRNFFEVEAAFDHPPAGLRPGLEGVAKIGAGTRPLGWIATHRIGEWLEMTLWSWIG
ncbi:MAG: hypothetical protein H6R10_3064 [Rhodocyclaceae bacterium]|nr:hypothetical protein [Rhodocyclaceae bacterium]